MIEVRLKPVKDTAPGPRIQDKFTERSRLFTILCYIQIVIGVLCIINAVLCICLQTAFADTAYGIWCGIIFAIAGGIGIGAIKNKSRAMVIVFMVLCVLSALLFAPIVILIAANEFRYDNKAHWKEFTDIDPKTNATFTYWKTTDPGGLAVKKALHVFMVLAGLVEGIVAIVCSVLCCMIVCGGGPPDKIHRMEAEGAVTYQLLLTIPKKNVDPDNKGPPYAREAVLSFPGPPKAGEPTPGTSQERGEEEAATGVKSEPPPKATAEDLSAGERGRLDDALKSDETKPKEHIVV